MSGEPLDLDLGPIDYLVMEWDGDQPATGEVMPMLLDLVDRRIIRILDLAFMYRDHDGSVSALDLAELSQSDGGLAEFEGVSSGLLSQEDIEEAGSVLEPGRAAAVLVWENRWASPVAAALRRTGGEVVATGRIPVQSILASLDATEPVH